MAQVKVTVTNRAIISALNTPGGAIHDWRDMIGNEIENTAFANSPVNDPLNAMHRDGITGVYKAGWDWDRRGSSGHHVVARVTNAAPHAVFVEWGRTSSGKMQIFSWAHPVVTPKFTTTPGDIVRVGGPTPAVVPPSRRVQKLSRGEIAYNARISKLPPRIGSRTAERAGEHILGKAVVAVLGSQGISARVDM
jgi:hypothetical protein